MLRSHEPSVVDDISAALGLDLAAPSCRSADTGGDTEEGGEEEERRVASAASAASGALLVHGPPGVGKTRLVSKRRG